MKTELSNARQLHPHDGDNKLKQSDILLPNGITYSVGVCEKFVNDPKRRSRNGGPRFTLHLDNHQRRLVLERHHESPFVNHPFYVVYQKPSWWGTWQDLDITGCIDHVYALERDENDPRKFLRRALAILGTGWVDGVCHNPNHYNLSALIGWYKQMESLKQHWIGIELELDKDENIVKTNKKIITQAAILHHFATLPQYDGCSLNHQCSRENFDRLRNIATAPSK
jgi:hypothetical protein